MEVANNMARRHPFILNARVSPARWAVNAVKGRLPAYDWEVVLRDLQQDCGCSAVEIAVSTPTRSGRRQAKVLLEEATGQDPISGAGQDPIAAFEKLLREQYPELVDDGGTGGSNPDHGGTGGTKQDGGSTGGIAARDKWSGRAAPREAGGSLRVGLTVHRPKLLSKPSPPSGSGSGREGGGRGASAASLDGGAARGAANGGRLGGRAPSGADVGTVPRGLHARFSSPEDASALREPADASREPAGATEVVRRGDVASQNLPVPSVLPDGTDHPGSDVEDRAPSGTAVGPVGGAVPQLSIPRGVRADVLTKPDPWLSHDGGEGERERTGSGAGVSATLPLPASAGAGAGPDWDWTGRQVPEGAQGGRAEGAGPQAGGPEAPRPKRLSPREREVEARVQLAVRKAREARERMRLWPRRTTRIYSVQGRGQGNPDGAPRPDDRT